MSDSGQLISALRVVAVEISRFREEVQAIRREINGLARTITPNRQAKSPKIAVPREQTREKWLKEAAVRASQKLFSD